MILAAILEPGSQWLYQHLKVNSNTFLEIHIDKSLAK